MEGGAGEVAAAAGVSERAERGTGGPGRGRAIEWLKPLATTGRPGGRKTGDWRRGEHWARVALVFCLKPGRRLRPLPFGVGDGSRNGRRGMTMRESKLKH